MASLVCRRCWHWNDLLAKICVRCGAALLWLILLLLLIAVHAEAITYQYTGPDIVFGREAGYTHVALTWMRAEPLPANTDWLHVTPDAITYRDGLHVDQGSAVVFRVFDVSTDAQGLPRDWFLSTAPANDLWGQVVLVDLSPRQDAVMWPDVPLHAETAVGVRGTWRILEPVPMPEPATGTLLLLSVGAVSLRRWYAR